MPAGKHQSSLPPMLRRAIISAFLTLAGVGMAAATPLNPEQKNMVLQPGNGASLTKSAVSKPGYAALWTRGPVQATHPPGSDC